MPTPPSRPVGYSSLPDDELVDLARSGDSTAYGELWRRHSAIGTAIARRYYQVADPDDLVSESFARILSTMQRGNGPRSGFRPYLITTIGNVARRWAVQAREGATDQLDYLEDPKTLEDPLVASTDRELALVAFRSLPERWQSVLWFSAVEGLGPRDVAANLGMTPNAAAVLAHRARTGLRTAWIQAHLNDATLDDECRWAAARLGRRATGALSSRELVRVSQHLSTCSICQSRAKELDDLMAKLAAFLIAALLGLSLTTIRPEGALTAGGTPPFSPTPPLTPSSPATALAPETAPAGVAEVAATVPTAPTAAAPAVAASTQAWLVSAVVAGIAAAAVAATVILPSVVAVETAPSGGPVDDRRATSSLLDRPATAESQIPLDDAPTSSPEPPNDSSSAAAPAVPPAAPTVTSAIDPDGVRPPTLSGLAAAGAQVLVFDDRGILISSVVADAAGAWSTGELAALSPAATALVVRQVDGSGAASPETTLGGLAPRPLIASPGYGNLEEPDVPFDLSVQGWPGAVISVTFTALQREGYISPSTYLPTSIVLDASGNGVLTVDSSIIWYHRADLRYVDGGRVAASIRGHCFQVGMTYPGQPQGVPPLRCTA